MGENDLMLNGSQELAQQLTDLLVEFSQLEIEAESESAS